MERVKDVTITKNDTIIAFFSNPNVHVNDYVGLKFREKEFIFKVDTITTMEAPVRNGSKLINVIASQVGYYADNLNTMENIDIRDVAGTEIYMITDEEKIKRIEHQSRWC
jgi:hypothetical protein